MSETNKNICLMFVMVLGGIPAAVFILLNFSFFDGTQKNYLSLTGGSKTDMSSTSCSLRRIASPLGFKGSRNIISKTTMYSSLASTAVSRPWGSPSE